MLPCTTIATSSVLVLSYRYRSEFTRPQRPARAFTVNRAEGDLSFQVSYDFNNQLRLFVEGWGLLNEPRDNFPRAGKPARPIYVVRQEHTDRRKLPVLIWYALNNGNTLTVTGWWVGKGRCGVSYSRHCSLLHFLLPRNINDQ